MKTPLGRFYNLLQKVIIRKRFYIIVFLLTHLVIAIFLRNVISLTLDEVAYQAMFEDLYKGDFKVEEYLGWANSNTLFLRVLYLPARLLNTFGVSSLLSIRLLGVAVSTLAFIVLLSMVHSSSKSHNKVPHIFWLYLIIPTFALWTSSGLREPLIIFALVLTIFGLQTIQDSNRFGYLQVFIGMSAMLLIKNYLYCLLGISILLCIILKIKSQNIVMSKKVLVLVVLAPLLIFQTASKPIYQSATSIWQSKSDATKTILATPRPVLTAGSSSEGMGQNGQTIDLLKKEISKNDGISHVLSFFLKFDLHSDFENSGTSREAMRQLQPAILTEPLTYLAATSNFMFRPNIFTDQGSVFLNILGWEGFIWFFLYGLFIRVIIKHNQLKKPNFPLLVVCLFSAAFIFMSALIEINVGTALRHRSVLAFSILIAFTLHHRENLKRFN